VRKLQIVETAAGRRPCPDCTPSALPMPGCKPFRVLLGWPDKQERYPVHGAFPSVIIPELDKMLGGGIPKAIVSWWQGLRGRENRVLATNFIAEGIRQGDPGIVVVFEERPQEYAERGQQFWSRF